MPEKYYVSQKRLRLGASLCRIKDIHENHQKLNTKYARLCATKRTSCTIDQIQSRRDEYYL